MELLAIKISLKTSKHTIKVTLSKPIRLIGPSTCI